MIRLLISLILLAGSLHISSVSAGEMVACFKRGELGTCSRPVLQHVKFKSVVLQFVDPADTGLGESLSRLMWREILESISDLSDAGVILAYDREGDIEQALGENDLGQFLEREYHSAADAIARQLNVQMSIWGAVLEDGDEVYAQPFLTLRQVDEDAWTTLSLSAGGRNKAQISALLGRVRLNLRPLRGTRAELFGRRFVTRCALRGGCPNGVALRAAPSNDSDIVDHVPVSSQVQVVDMQRQWLKVVQENGTFGWINIYHLEMFPVEIDFFHRTNINLRSSPGGRRLARIDLDGTFLVLDGQRHGPFDEPWYLIEVGQRRGWVAGRLVNRRSYTFPAVHLIAGLYRYGRGQYDKAAEELEAFLVRSLEEDNVTRAAALQFLAASRVAGHKAGSRIATIAMRDLNAAAKLTPFDANVYTLRAVVQVGAHMDIVPAMVDLKRAFELNRRDKGATQVLKDLSEISRHYGLSIFAPGRSTESAHSVLKGLEEAYLQCR